jgi:hypothetical protein
MLARFQRTRLRAASATRNRHPRPHRFDRDAVQRMNVVSAEVGSASYGVGARVAFAAYEALRRWRQSEQCAGSMGSRGATHQRRDRRRLGGVLRGLPAPQHRRLRAGCRAARHPERERAAEAWPRSTPDSVAGLLQPLENSRREHRAGRLRITPKDDLRWARHRYPSTREKMT